MKKLFILLFVSIKFLSPTKVQAQIPGSGAITMKQIANYMYSLNELTLAEKNAPYTIASLNGLSHLSDKTPNYSLSDWYGYKATCVNFTVTHSAGTIAPVNKTVTYGTVTTRYSGSNKCWITQNLGSDQQATSAFDATEASAGWYWQFNTKRGYKVATNTPSPSGWNAVVYTESSDWIPANDPCLLLLGTGWRIPTATEYINVIGAPQNWANPTDAFNSVLKIHMGGTIYESGTLDFRGGRAYYWTSNQGITNNIAITLDFNVGTACYMQPSWDKRMGEMLRCIRD